MKKKVIVKRYEYPNKTHEVLHCTDVEIEKGNDGIKLMYKEKNKEGVAEVKVMAKEHSIRIWRKQDHESRFLFLPKQISSGTITSAMGCISVSFYTHRYIKKDNVITLEYEIRQGNDVVGRYTFLWSIKENEYESN